jgi:hypothetical protein
MRVFPNGFESWQETHFEVVSEIAKRDYLCTSTIIENIRESQGIGGLYELAEELTDRFEVLNKDREWDGEFFYEIEQYLNKELL